MMITLNDLINGTAVDAPPEILHLFALAEEALVLEGKLEEMPAGDGRIDHIWEKAAARTMRRVDRLEAAIQDFNDMELVVEVMIVCGS